MPGPSASLVAPYRRRQPSVRGSTAPAVPAAPDTPSTPSPANAAQTLYSLLSWVSARQARADIYLSTSALLYQAYATAVIADTPLGYWRLGEASGSAAADLSGHGRPGTYNAAGVTYGQPGAVADGNTGVALNGTTGYVTVSDPGTLGFTDVFTFEIWVNLPAGLTFSRVLIGAQTLGGAGGAGIVFSNDTAMNLVVERIGVGVPIATSTSGIPADSQWHHCVWTKNGAANHIYIDGVDVTGAVTNVTITHTNDLINIGSINGAGNFLPGSVDEVAIYGYALTPTQVANHYALRTAINATPVVPKYVGTSYVPTLLPSLTYYWQIVAFNDGGSAPGPIWSFTTPSATLPLIAVASVLSTTAQFGSLSIQESLSASPNTASLRLLVAPTAGAAIQIGIGSLDAAHLIFAGEIQRVDQAYVGPQFSVWTATLVDPTWAFNKRRPFGTFTLVSGTTIALALLAQYAPSFTANHVQLNLPVVSVSFDGTADLITAFGTLATAIAGVAGTPCYMKVDYTSDVHLFLAATAPAAVALAVQPPLNDPTPIVFTYDLTQIRTREYGKGAGTTTRAAVAIGAPTLPIADGTAFASTGGQVLVGSQVLSYASKGVAYTPNAAAWTKQTGGNATRTWTGIAWAPALGIFVAVAGNGSATVDVMTSPDGINWTTQAPAVASTWEAVAWAPELALFVAVSNSGLVMTSPEGVWWTQRTAADTSGWLNLVWAPGLHLFVVVATTAGVNGFQVMTSPDGIVWTGRVAPSASQWTAVDWSPTLGLLVAVAATGSPNAIMSSPDGVTWTAAAVTGNWFQVKWSAPLTLFLVIAGTTTATSPDGLNWTTHGAALPSANWHGLVWTDAGLFVALSDASTNSIAVSPDGLTWTTFTAPALATTGRWALAWSPTLGLAMAVGFTGGGASVLMSNLVASDFNVLTGINANNGVPVAIAAGAAVNVWVQVDNLAAQAALGALELDTHGTPTDGIREYTLVNTSLTAAQLTAALQADLALMDAPIVTATYYTRDPLAVSGNTVAIALTLSSVPYGLSGIFTIQSVAVTLPATDGPALYPLRQVTASSVAFTLMDLLRKAVLG